MYLLVGNKGGEKITNMAESEPQLNFDNRDIQLSIARAGVSSISYVFIGSSEEPTAAELHAFLPFATGSLLEKTLAEIIASRNGVKFKIIENWGEDSPYTTTPAFVAEVRRLEEIVPAIKSVVRARTTLDSAVREIINGMLTQNREIVTPDTFVG